MLHLPTRSSAFLAAAVAVSACDTSPIAYNVYSIESVKTPIDTVAQQKKVYIGHSLPVNVTVTAKYTEKNIPLQFYLLNVDDVQYVEKGIGDAGDVRAYYCYQTPYTRINTLEAGTHTYGVVINIPAEQAKDEFTGDFKVGEYYVVADVDAGDQAEIDAFAVYRRFAGRLDKTNTIFVASDYLKKPDLSVESMNFTGTTEAPADSVTFYQLDMSKLPGAAAANLPSFYIKPSPTDRMFEGTVDVKSSSADTLNVPIKFFLESKDGTISVPLEIYDTTLKGFTPEYFIPILRKNTTESVTLQFRVPDDKDAYYFSAYGTDRWSATEFENDPNRDKYPLFELFYAMMQIGPIEQTWLQENVSVNYITTNDVPHRDYHFNIKAVVNADGKVTESRFIAPNDDNSQYTTDSYLENGDVFNANNLHPLITLANNARTEDLILRIEKIYVAPNEGAKFYPCSKLDADNSGVVDDADCDPELGYRQMVIFWGGWGAHVGNNNIGAGFDAWAGTFFRNYSLFSMGVNLYGHVADFLTGQHLVEAQGGYRISLNAESHPFDTDKAFYEFVVLGSMLSGMNPGVDVQWGGEDDWWQGSFNVFTFKDEAQGFGDYTLNTPITFSKLHIGIPFEIGIIGLQLDLNGGFGGIYILPRTKMALNRDGSLRFDVGATVSMGVDAELSGQILFELIQAGIAGSIDIVSFDFDLGVFTKVYYDQEKAPGLAKGSIGLGPSIWLTGPQGQVKAWIELPLLFATIRIEQTILSFTAFKLKLYDEPFIESDKTGWVQLARPDLIDYSYPDLLIDGQ